MKKIYLVILVFILIKGSSFGQGAVTICNDFDASINHIHIDSESIWEIGQPEKTVFNSSYTGLNSIVTDLDSLYPNNDTSVFIAIFKDEYGGVPNYLGLYPPIEIEFNHRFICDTNQDFGLIEMSLDNGETWYDILSSEYNADWGPNMPYANEHYFEGTGITIYDSLSITGNSNGWVNSHFSKDIEQIIMNDNIIPDSIIVKFSFISDDMGRDEGWQIDDLCLFMDIIDDIAEESLFKELTVFPNPATDLISFQLPQKTKGEKIQVFDVQGNLIEEICLETDQRQVIWSCSHIPKGVYFYQTQLNGEVYTGKIVVN